MSYTVKKKKKFSKPVKSNSELNITNLCASSKFLKQFWRKARHYDVIHMVKTLFTENDNKPLRISGSKHT